ncbi:type II toxin-antitoxin system VapC family toxin [Duganella qianjiadongensis]|uniref:PIN domain-containing protein n=1 Tax=Duganella qianjiadongensis TaxID=2692176 RepID=A0ABW9VHA4_9BURK|nr:type II toxin-antitoxin system VapC family toxin [Duganella qianjiadongensis]MYM38547.1 PIN domain-containing protein [Duganella qianjiadongensis]
MIGLDTNVLARYYIADQADAEAQRQRLQALNVLESGTALAVCKTVIIELEWLMRHHYGLDCSASTAVIQHLLSQPQITIEDRPAIMQALRNHLLGLSFADALHHASYLHCTSMLTFDDRKFARRVRALKLTPTVKLP